MAICASAENVYPVTKNYDQKLLGEKASEYLYFQEHYRIRNKSKRWL